MPTTVPETTCEKETFQSPAPTCSAGTTWEVFTFLLMDSTINGTSLRIFKMAKTHIIDLFFASRSVLNTLQVASHLTLTAALRWELSYCGLTEGDPETFSKVIQLELLRCAHRAVRESTEFTFANTEFYCLPRLQMLFKDS